MLSYRHLFLLALLPGFLSALPMPANEPAPFTWIEAEQPTRSNLKVGPASTGHPEWLSGGKWLFVVMEADKVARDLPSGGAVLEYDFTLSRNATYEVWNRAGMEFVRSPFEWRIDKGEWIRIDARDPKFQTIDLMELATWNEVGWLRMGTQQLAAGKHTLAIRLPKARDAQGKPARVLYASDCYCISAAPFHPYSRFKPGETDRDGADEQAAKQVFKLPAGATAAGRSSVRLKGTWEVCRHDEALPGPVAKPIKDFPTHPRWKAIAVPGDKNTQRPDLLFAHRLWYRTRVQVPASLAGRSFFLTFPQNNLNTTVFVNGVYCGFNKNPYVHFDIDVTAGIKPGQVNEVWVGIRDYWYGYTASSSNPTKLREKFNLPPNFAQMGFQDLAYPVWNAVQSGILVTPTLTAAGAVYAEDVFVKPSVAHKQLAALVTIANPSGRNANAEVICEAVDPKTGKVAHTLPAQSFRLAAGKERKVEVTGPWADPKLWWPDDPNLYELRTTLKVGGKPIDIARTPFGFREWGSRGKHFTLNGVVWHGWNMGIGGATPEQWLAYYRKTNQTQWRMAGATQGGNRPFFGLSPDDALNWMDRHGVVIRRCGILDGEAIGYMAIENDPRLRKKYGSQIKMELMDNWVEQMAAQVKGERNHPSIQVWSIENEWLYINCINLYGGLMDEFEREVLRCTKAVQALDPTRPVMTDGGGANKDQAMPVHGNHYVALDNPGGLTAYPGRAYGANPTGGGRQRWLWDEKRPRYLGEDLFFAGNHPELATLGGEAAMTGKAGTFRACGLLLQILQQGYRWSDFGAWDFYTNPGDADDSQWLYFAPRVVLCRQWDWTFASGKPVKRTLAIFNDTHSAEPIDLVWELQVPGQKGYRVETIYRVPPGKRRELEITLPIPQGEARAEGKLILTLSVQGKEVFRDAKQVTVLNPAAATLSLKKSVGAKGRSLAVYDPAGAVMSLLKEREIPFVRLEDLKNLPRSAHILLIGKDALTPGESTSSRLAAYASAGRTVIVLEQTHPLRYQGLPAAMEAEKNEGRVGFGEDPDHPALRGLKDKDFFTWGPDELLYRNAYVKPAGAARSLVQCGNLLRNSALVEMPAGKGLLLLSQLLIEEKLGENAVAQQLLQNLIAYGAGYKQEFRPVTAVVGDAPLLGKTLDGLGVRLGRAEDPLAALKRPGSILVLSATPAHLKALADHPDQVKQFTASGGWIVLNGLTPAGLASYNKLVSWDHVIRPFKRERVTPASIRRPLMAGITGTDVAMFSSQRIFNYQEGNYVVSDEFSYVVDYDDIAPFSKSSFFAYDNIVNGFVNADGWPLIINFPINKDGSPYNVPITFPKPQTVTEFTWIGNTNYWPQTKINLLFGGDNKDIASFAVQPTGDPQILPVKPPRTVKVMTLQIAGWQQVPNKGALVGIDNIYIKVQRPLDFYRRVKPLLNIGGMMEYPRGKGGILLCNLLFKEREEVPLNAVKKRNILAALLRNLQAPFAGKTVIAGANLEYRPLDLSRQANAFRNERGWFGDRRFTFRDLPTGRQVMAGVVFDIYEFATSPVPTVVMVGPPNNSAKAPQVVKGIPVNRKADALFFLQAARVDRRRNADDIQKGRKYELARYVIHYADGKAVDVPVHAEIHVDHYHQKTPAALPGAQLAWSRPFEGMDQTAAAYSMQWNNPRPEVVIASIDLVVGADRAGMPALLAVTAASTK